MSSRPQVIKLAALAMCLFAAAFVLRESLLNTKRSHNQNPNTIPDPPHFSEGLDHLSTESSDIFPNDGELQAPSEREGGRMRLSEIYSKVNELLIEQKSPDYIAEHIVPLVRSPHITASQLLAFMAKSESSRQTHALLLCAIGRCPSRWAAETLLDVTALTDDGDILRWAILSLGQLPYSKDSPYIRHDCRELHLRISQGPPGDIAENILQFVDTRYSEEIRLAAIRVFGYSAKSFDSRESMKSMVFNPESPHRVKGAALDTLVRATLTDNDLADLLRDIYRCNDAVERENHLSALNQSLFNHEAQLVGPESARILVEKAFSSDSIIREQSLALLENYGEKHIGPALSSYVHFLESLEVDNVFRFLDVVRLHRDGLFAGCHQLHDSLRYLYYRRTDAEVKVRIIEALDPNILPNREMLQRLLVTESSEAILNAIHLALNDAEQQE